MARSVFVSILTVMAKSAARSQRIARREQTNAAREYARAERERVREVRVQAHTNAATQKEAIREAKQQYLEDQTAKATEENALLASCIEELSHLLEATLSVDDRIAFDSLRLSTVYPAFTPPAELTQGSAPPHEEYYLHGVVEPKGLGRFVPGAQKRYEAALEEATKRFESAKKHYQTTERARLEKLAQLQAEYDQSKQSTLEKSRQRNQEVDELAAAYEFGDPTAIVTYNSMVLERSDYPVNFPQQYRLAYIPESKKLVIEYQLPGPDIIPPIQEYRYVKNRDVIEEKPRKKSDIKNIYQEVVAAIALRTVHEVLEADQVEHVQVVAFNGFVDSIDPATGKARKPCLISLQVTRDRFMELDLDKIDKRVCLRNLGAQVSQSPNEMVAIKPVVNFDMVDKRFVDQGDILSDLESRPNLMELKPFEFETLVANLFHQMGIESKLTRSSRDGGVDVVGFDKRPILGGKVVIQAKRYRSTVGVSAVRDLYGTMMNEGANKGILVATSGYGPDAFDFSKDKPIELIDGGGLLYLLEQVGTKARIVMPFESEG
ncbi:MAG: restriction endonuclease [Nitrospirota bacterium]